MAWDQARGDEVVGVIDEELGGKQASVGSLGNIARIVSPYNEKRLLRYALQAEAGYLLPSEKVSYCLQRSKLGHVDVLMTREMRRAHYGGLFTCGSVWMCTVCSAKITERRRGEMSIAICYCNKHQHLVCMQTYTFSHKRYDSLLEALQSYLAARRRVKQGKRYQWMKVHYKIVGTINALEITWSPRNGWHVHGHELVIFEDISANLDAYEADARDIWDNAARLEGLMVNKRGYRLDRTRGGVEDYIAKWGHEPTRPVWGPEAEIAKGHIKQARNEKGMTPFGLLAASYQGDEQAGRLFVEFATCFKGKHQLHWSKGLKELVGLKHKTDEEIAAEDREESDLFGQLTREHWQVVRANQVRGELLQVLERNGLWSDVEQFLRELGVEV